MRLSSKKILFAIAFFMSTFICSAFTYGAYIIDNTTSNFDGPEENMLQKLGVTGDSYGGFLIDALSEYYELDLANYCKAATTIEENKDKIIECIYDRYKYIVLSIGVNDHAIQTDMLAFVNRINFFAELAKKLNKQLILHTYMTYPLSSLYSHDHKCEEYDAALKVVDNLYDCVWYVDMHDVNDDCYYQKDLIHYNEEYYKILIQRILETLDIIKQKNET